MFTTYIYQPIFNTLIATYWALGQISPASADIGVATIIFALLIYLLLFPLSLSSLHSQKEEQEILSKIKEIKKKHAHHDQRRIKAILKQTLKKNPRIMFSNTTKLFLQLIILVALHRFFTKGLQEKDLQLLYDFMPKIEHLNPLFLSNFSLSSPNSTLNLTQSLMFFATHFLSSVSSPLPSSRKESLLMQILLPIFSYFTFLFLPSGLNLFLLTFLSLSALFFSFRTIKNWFTQFDQKLHESQSNSERSQANTPQKSKQ